MIKYSWLSFLIFCVSSSALARVLSVEIQQRDTIVGGRSWGNAGAYEMLRGKVFFGTDPESAYNQMVTDIHLAPVDEDGLVRSSSDLVVLKPLDASKSNLALVEVSNRGGKFTPSYFLNGQGRLTDPQDPEAFGDGLLLKRGYTLIWVGWQFDLPPDEELLHFITPIAKYPEGTPIIGLVRSDWTVDQSVENLKLGHRDQLGYEVYDPASGIHHLTRRVGRNTPRIEVPRSEWGFGQKKGDGIDEQARWIHSKDSFQAGNIYELVYHSYDPPLVGLGLTAIRDIISYAKYDPTCPFPVQYGMAAGVSQTGRLLRMMLYQGFNQDEFGRKAYDGMMIMTAGAGRGSFNHRFAQPSRDAHRYSAFFYPTDIFPFSSRTQYDSLLNKRDGLLDHLDPALQPRIFYINTGYEYWGRAAGLIHTTPDGNQDLPPLEHERIYHIASGQHYVGRLPDPAEAQTKSMFTGNPLQFKPNYRALVVAMGKWITENTAPPDSQYPTIADGTLVPVDKVKYPDIPGFKPAVAAHEAYRADYGPNWERGIISRQPPALGQAFPSLVPQVDLLGNERGGIRNVEIVVPLATYVPYALRQNMAGGNGELLDFQGTWIPLPLKPEAKDPRPAISALYQDQNDYMLKVRNVLEGLVDQGYVLKEDIHQLSARANQYWNLINQTSPREDNPVNVMTFNIRYDNPGDGLSAWPNRKDFAIDVVEEYDPDFLGLQEALEHQCKDVNKGLRGYRWFGVGREDGHKQGEYAPIFYQRKRWKLLDWNTFWLSPTPDQPSKGWDAAFERIVTWGKFEEKRTGSILYVFNTHFDHRGEEARWQSVLLIKDQIRSICGTDPYVLMGDFNFDTQSKPYLTITTPDNAYTVVDAGTISATPVSGPAGTFSGFEVDDDLPFAQIDHIFVSPQTRVKMFEIVNRSKNGRYPSDHFPVFTRLQPW